MVINSWPEDGLNLVSDILIYWRDYKQTRVYEGIGERPWYWQSNAKLVGELLAGDRGAPGRIDRLEGLAEGGPC